MRIPLAATACMLLLALAPPPAAAEYSGCSARAQYWQPGATCSFDCQAGEFLHVAVRHADPNVSVTGTAQCGDQVATCTAPPVVSGWESTCEAQSPAYTQQGGSGTCSVTPPSGYFYESLVDCWTTSGLTPIDPIAFESPPAGTPGVGGGSLATPSVTVPGLQPIPSPAIGVPETCSAAACHAPTTLPPLGTPYVDDQCAPLNVLCVGPVDPYPVYGGGSAPALCDTAAGAACLPAGPAIVPGGIVTTPDLPSRTIGPYVVPIPYVEPQAVPGAAVYVNNTGFNAAPPSTGTSYVQPIPVTGPPVPVTLCGGAGCPIPLTLRNGIVTLTVTVNGQERHVDLMV